MHTRLLKSTALPTDVKIETASRKEKLSKSRPCYGRAGSVGLQAVVGPLVKPISF
jgi:hypothetical protein